jgi:hypothetical protein
VKDRLLYPPTMHGLEDALVVNGHGYLESRDDGNTQVASFGA